MKRKGIKLNQLIPGMPFNFITMAVFSLILIGLSFALYLRSLGFYLDDWPQMYSLVVRGVEGIKTYFLFDDRPFGWWPDLLVYKLWGTNPIGWHITNYLLRWLVGLGIWGVFSQLWPGHKREVFWFVLLFAVYPLFNQQSMGLTFIAHWFCYALFFLSLYLMILAVKHPKYRWLFLILSLAVNMPNLFTYENFIGVEYIRPILLWLGFRNESKQDRIKKTLLYWLPFLLLAGFYIIWRVFLMENYRGLDPVLFTNLMKSPGTTLIQMANFIIRDVTFMIIAVWYPTLDPWTFDLSSPHLVISYFLALLVILLLYFYIWKNSKIETEQNQAIPESFSIEAIAIGLFGVVLGLAPGWLIGRSVTETGIWADRFGLPGMWAAPIFLVGIITLILRTHSKKAEIFFILLIGLAVGRNFAVTNDYKWSATWQNRFFSQLKWRAPGLQANTSILSNNELFGKVGVYPTSFMLNLFYPTVQPMPQLDYWFYTLHKYFPNNLGDLATGMEVSQGHWYAKYKADSRNSLVISWTTANQHCLWVLSTNDKYNPLIDVTTKSVLGASNLTRIINDDKSPWPDSNLFGKENRDTWCYYYESADLSRQLGQWNDVIDFYEEATVKGYEPFNGVELMPFIEAYARVGKADVAMDLTMLAKAMTPSLRDFTCDNWNRIAKDIFNDPIFTAEYQEYSQQDLCWEVK